VAVGPARSTLPSLGSEPGASDGLRRRRPSAHRRALGRDPRREAAWFNGDSATSRATRPGSKPRPPRPPSTSALCSGPVRVLEQGDSRFEKGARDREASELGTPFRSAIPTCGPAHFPDRALGQSTAVGRQVLRTTYPLEWARVGLPISNEQCTSPTRSSDGPCGKSQYVHSHRWQWVKASSAATEE
jgi:hypothetical protein